MAIRHRRGNYTDLDPTKSVSGEVLTVLADDPNTTDGQAVYASTSSGQIKRLVTHNELQAYNAQAEAILENVQTLAQNTETYSRTANTKAAEASQSASDALQAKNNAQQIVTSAEDTIDAYAEQRTQQAVDDIDEAYQDRVDEINNTIDRIVNLKFDADQLARQALEKATQLDNEFAEASSSIDNLKSKVNNLQFEVDERVAGGYVDVGGYLVLTDANGDQIGDRIGPFAGGGGGGGSTVTAVLTAENTTGWISKTISEESDCNVKILWSSVENDMPTGNGTATIKVNNIVKGTLEIRQGEITINLKPYLNSGTNNIKVIISDTYGQERPVSFNVSVISLNITSSFDTSNVFDSTIPFPYVVFGDVTKTIYFIVDGTTVATQTTSVSGRQLTQILPTQSHGPHTLRVYFEATINEETVRSNELYYEFIAIEALNNTTIIVSNFNRTTVNQYESIPIPYRVYTPNASETEVQLYVNNTLVSTQTVDRTEQSYTVRANEVGSMSFRIEARGQSKSISFTVIETEIDVEAETEDLVLYLTAQGRSNNEETRSIWSYNDIVATMSGFTWKLDGWQTDSDGINVLRLVDDARVTIPYQVFATDLKNTGKTIEIEFATRDVANYDVTLVSCFADNIGFTITPQSVTFRGAQTSINTLYKDGEHIRLSIVVAKQNADRLILIYINGIMSRAIQYASGERFSQTTPVGISIGSNDCGIDVYNIRVYDNDLNRQQILDNWIADTQVGTTMLERYTHNNVYDAYGNITPANLPKDLPYYIIEAAELPQYKGDKKTVSGSYTDPVYPSNSFTFTGCQINVQGTSSAVYFRKNYDMQFKEGFIMQNGTKASTYKIRSTSIPFNRFVLKADVASSESANNTELTMFYNDSCPYKTPEMEVDSRVRWGIEGIPIAVFWYDTQTQTTQFMGKYNFNLPKRAPAPYGYSGNDESWEWERNNSLNVKFQDADFTTQKWDETEQQYYPEWYDDFEARFPSDEWRDYSKLREMLLWVKSTWRSQATGDTFAEPIVYRLNTTVTVSAYSDDTSFTVEDEMDGGTATGYKILTFTKDTPAYRLTKFRAEFSDRFELESAAFYYLFTLMFLMIDSRAKNMFIGFHGSNTSLEETVIDRKAVFEPYDMDTAIGINNSGVLAFGYYLEDTDTVSSIISGQGGGTNAPVYNAQDSVLWENFRDAFRSEYTTMYRNLRASGAWSYDAVKTRFEEHQAKWPEAIFNEDAYTKYLVPLVNPVTYDEDTKQYIKTDRYLTMLQGSKAEQRKWWLYNRFRYIDSKFSTGDAYNKIISMRVFNSGTLTLTPAIDMYLGVSFGGGTTIDLKRTTANVSKQFVYSTPSGVTEMETWIYSGDMIRDVGDLSVFYPNEIDFSKATRLKTLKIGDNTQGYSNTNLTTIDVRNSTLLETIDVRNCPNLKITVDLESSSRLREAYFDGTAITGVELADGCVIETLHLPGSITVLTLLNLSNLTDFVCPDYSHISRLMLDSIDQDVVDPIDVLQAIQSGSQINIKGLYIEAQDATEIENFFDLLDTMTGVSREKNASGEWIYREYDKAQVSGEIHTDSLTGAQIASFNERYPYVRVTADHTSALLTYKTYDGSSVIDTETVLDGGNGTKTNSTQRTSTAQYNFTPDGWATSPNGAKDANALVGVTADRTVYAAYTSTLRSYTITFVRASADGGGTLQSSTYQYGATPSYTGATPTTTQGSATDYPFEGWTPAITTVTGATTYTAKFGSPIEVAEITDSWDTIIANIDNGTYATKYKVGNYKPLDLGTEGTINMQIVAFDKDKLASGGTAPITFLGMELLNTLHEMNPMKSPSSTPYTEGTGAIGGWDKCEMKTYLKNTVKPLIPSNVRIRINNVIKYSRIANTNAQTVNNSPSIDDVWIPSRFELRGSGTYSETKTIWYKTVYPNNAACVKHRPNKTDGEYYWLRSYYANVGSTFSAIKPDGDSWTSVPNADYGVCLGFCLGLEAETITDSWSDIFTNESNGTYSTKYSVGDTKMIDLGTEGKHLMEIVAMDTDDLADGSGKAKITWLSRTLLNTSNNMNPIREGSSGNYTEGTGSIGGWDKCEMKTYLNTTIANLVPTEVRNNVKTVKKYTRIYNTAGTVVNNVESSETFWLASILEVGLSKYKETAGVTYSSVFADDASRKKKTPQGSAYAGWWLRSAYYGESFATVSKYGDISYGGSGTVNRICLGFCT